MFNLSLILEDSARRYANHVAISDGKIEMSYTQLNQQVNRLANALKNIGLISGDKIAMSVPNIIDFPVIYYAVLKLGAIVVPLNILLKKDEILYHLDDSNAKVYFCYSNEETLPIADQCFYAFNKASQCTHFITLDQNIQFVDERIMHYNNFIKSHSNEFTSAQTGADDRAVLVYTSGTTGLPKGAELTHFNLFCNAQLVADLFETSNRDVQLLVLPLFHIFGMTTLMNAGIYRGAKHVLVPRFDPQTIMEIIVQQNITVFAGVPTMYWALLNFHHQQLRDEDISNSLRLCVSGGASLAVKVLQDFQDRFNVQVIEGYGMSEGSPVVTFNDIRLGFKPGSIGLPVWGVDVKIIDQDGNTLPNYETGELVFRGHNVMKGYYNKHTATEEAIENGWMHSGDVAYRDDEGFYFIVDRTKDMIIRGGMNVYSREIEEIMMKHPAISLVAVIGIPDEKLGEEIKAVVVLKEQEEISEDELICWTKDRLAKYKYPRVIHFANALPISATGKILKKELRAADNEKLNK